MLAVTDCRLPYDCRASLEALGYEVILLPPFPSLSAPVASHPDMLMFILDGTLLTHKDYYSIAKNEIDRISMAGNFKLILSEEAIGSEYPADILFNAAHVGDNVFAKSGGISHHIFKIATQYGKNIINIKQGYARCSLCIVDDHSIITSDRSLAAAARDNGLDVLMIRPGHIRLDGYNTGFIGGASGRIGDRIFFCGDINSHPDAISIKAFCAAHYREAVSLGHDELFDAGTLFFI